MNPKVMPIVPACHFLKNKKQIHYYDGLTRLTY